MAMRVYLIIFIALARCKGDRAGYSSTIGNRKLGELLKPPPLPLSQILPVPFHGGAGRPQRQNSDVGYQYQPPPPPPQAPIPFPSDFKFPAPFYKQYNFNFVPPPQPFTTTPSPSLFQKVSTWLFPSQQTSYDAGLDTNNLGPINKECNPCNLVPWIPVIRYNLGAKSNQVYQSNNPTYGPPSPTALADSVAKFQAHSFLQQNGGQKSPQLLPGIPHAVYGPPTSTFNSYSGGGVISSTYGPPSPTHTIPSQNPISSTFIASSSPYSVPSSSYGVPGSSIRQPSSSYLPTQGVSVTSYNTPTSTYQPPTSLYTTPVASYQSPFPVTTYGPPVTPFYEPGTLNNDLQPQNEIGVLEESGPSGMQQLPKVAQPTGFRNSYGELISNPYNLNSLYPVSATAAESTKVKTQVLPNDFSRPPNHSLSLANPAPFTLNRGRNIHTLQPVALPNLSVSPLPPIFNARPFRPVASPFPLSVLQGINHMQQKPSKVEVAQSIPLVEYTHSVDYPASFVQSPVIDFESLQLNNQTKAYRNIPNHFVIDQIRDISSQASEDHVQATKDVPEASFESTGGDIGNDIYDTGLPPDLNSNSYHVASNHKQIHNFGDLRGYKDEDVDKYRTESNLQSIDSPLLYLKPSAPHKGFGNFVFAVSTPVNDNEFEMYDDVLASTPSSQPPPITAWDESRNEYSETLSPSPEQSNTYQPKIVQIIVPYTTGKKENNNNDYDQQAQQWAEVNERHQGRKIPSNTDAPYLAFTENYNSSPTTTDEPISTVTESNDERLTSAAILNDLYDVKEPPFDIVKLQHNIDDWTEQEYSKYKPPQRTRSSEKYAKKIPDEYFVTTIPTNFVTEIDNYYDMYDHEGSSSNHHSVTDKSDKEYRPQKEYNTIERVKSKHNTAKNQDQEEIHKLHIYTAASSFRVTTSKATTTTSPAPWGKIQTSISPLTKEKVYVVTSKPWRDTRNSTKDWYDLESFESKKKSVDDDTSASEVSYKSPRFMQRPSFGFTSGGKVDSAKSDSSYGFSRSWYQSINELETKNNSTTQPETPRQKVTTGSEEITDNSNRHRYK